MVHESFHNSLQIKEEQRFTYLLLTELSRSVCENLDRGREVQTERSEVCTHDRGQDSPIQTD